MFDEFPIIAKFDRHNFRTTVIVNNRRKKYYAIIKQFGVSLIARTFPPYPTDECRFVFFFFQKDVRKISKSRDER